MNENNQETYDITKNPHFDKLLEILACPKCKGDLDFQAEKRRWLCRKCDRYYYIEEGIPNFLIDESVVRVISARTGAELTFNPATVAYEAKDEAVPLAEMEKTLNMKKTCLEEGCDGELTFVKEKMAYQCPKCQVEYPIPFGITHCLLTGELT